MSEKHTLGRLHTGGDGTIVYASDGWAVCNATVFHARHGGGGQKSQKPMPAAW